MCDVRKFAVHLVVAGLTFCMLAGGAATAQVKKKKKDTTQVHRETNATRLARIKKTTEETYAHRYEVIGGGGFLRFRNGEYTQRNDEVTWATAFNYYLNKKLAVVGDARGSFGRGHQQMPLYYPQIARPQINEYTFMGGASYRFYAEEKWALSMQGLIGTGWGLFSGGAKGLTGPQVGLWQDGIRPAFSVGASADYNLYPNLAIRFTPTYVGTNFTSVQTYVQTSTNGVVHFNGGNSSSIQNNLGFNIGVVYRFGRR
jgi:hypothetical protein